MTVDVGDVGDLIKARRRFREAALAKVEVHLT